MTGARGRAVEPVYVDCHSHFTTVPQALKQWRREQIAEFEQHGHHLSADGLVISDDELAQALTAGQLPLQAEYGISLSLMSPIAGLMAHHYGDQETSLTWSRLSNDVIHRVTRLFPGNVAGVCQLPQSPGASIDACVAELRRCVTELGFVGCNLNPDPSDGYWQAPPITDPYYYPLYAEMTELGVPAMVHASMSANPAVQGTCGHYLNSDTTTFMQLAQSTLFQEFPGLRLILPHGGGGGPLPLGPLPRSHVRPGAGRPARLPGRQPVLRHLPVRSARPAAARRHDPGQEPAVRLGDDRRRNQ